MASNNFASNSLPQTSIGLSIVIPVFRAENSLLELHRRIVDALEALDMTFEIILVEDCGGDKSWYHIADIAAQDKRVRGLRLSKNYGQHNALLCGIRAASGDVIVTLDDDLQHPPEEINKLLAKLEEGYDVVYGPPEREQQNTFRNLASQITKIALEESMGAANAKQLSAFRAFRAELRTAFSDAKSPTANVDVLLTWSTNKFASVRVIHLPRKYGQSGYTMKSLIRHALNMMTGYSVRPLQLASLLGFVFSIFGFFILLYILVRWLAQGSTVPGFAFLASLIAIFSGVQLLAIGIIGEYIARMYIRTMEMPAYNVAEAINF